MEKQCSNCKKILSCRQSLWRHKKNCHGIGLNQSSIVHPYNSYSKIPRQHHRPEDDDLQIEQKKLDKLHDEFRKSADTANNHAAIQHFGNGKEKPNTFAEEEESSSRTSSSSSENGTMINDLTINEDENDTSSPDEQEDEEQELIMDNLINDDNDVPPP